MKIHHINCGTLRPIGGRLIDGHGGLLHRGELVCHCLLIDTGTELVLVETGIGAPGVERPEEWLGKRFVRRTKPVADPEQTAARQVERLGYRTEDVRHIVLTHLDLDHAGGLVDFPDAQVHVYAEELDTLLNPRTPQERARYRTLQFAHRPRWQPHAEPGETWFGFDAVRELPGLPPEILLIPLAGHTRGHAGVAVDTGQGWLLHAGDSYFFHGELDPAHPHCPPLLAAFEAKGQMIGRERIDNQRRLRELVREHGDTITVFSAHDAVELRRLQTSEIRFN